MSAPAADPVDVAVDAHGRRESDRHRDHGCPPDAVRCVLDGGDDERPDSPEEIRAWATRDRQPGTDENRS